MTQLNKNRNDSICALVHVYVYYLWVTFGILVVEVGGGLDVAGDN